MIYLYGFIFAGTLCAIGQIILDNTKLTPGHVTALFVVLGALLNSFGIYDKFIDLAGAGALIPITNFGHLLSKGAIEGATLYGHVGLMSGMFTLTSAGIVSAMLFAFVFAMIFKPQN